MSLILTIIFLALLIIGIVRKANVTSVLLILSIVGLAIQVAMGADLLGEATTGSPIFDIFQYAINTIATQFADMGLVCVLVAAYCGLMVDLNATNKLALIICKPLALINSKVLILLMMTVVTYFLKVPITVSPAVSALTAAIFIPIMKKNGIPLHVGAPFVLLPIAVPWSPAGTGPMASARLMGIEEFNMATWFTDMMVPLSLIGLVFLLILMYISYRIFDSKEMKEASIRTDENVEEIVADCPTFYALLPLLPIILLLVFSPLIIASISMSVLTAVLVSLFISMIVHMIFSRKPAACFYILERFFENATKQFKLMGLMIPIAILYAGVLNRFGGMKLIADVFYDLSLPAVPIVVILTLFAGILNFAIGSFYGSIAIVMPLGGSIAQTMGINPLFLAYLLCAACSYGSMSSPVCPTQVVIQKAFDVEVGGLIKRMQIATWGVLIVEAVIGTILFA